MNRRDFMTGAALGAATLALPSFGLDRAFAASQRPLRIGTRQLEINGKAAPAFSLLGPDGKPGLTLDAGTDFDVLLKNGSPEETIIHWHGLTPPYAQDGVAGFPAPMLKPGEERSYQFPLGQGGTFWMHAHTLQEQRLLAAPLIVHTAEDREADEQEIVILLHDFSFRSPEELLAGLTGKEPAGPAGMDHSRMKGSQKQNSMPGMDMTQMGNMDGQMGDMTAMSPDMAGMDLNDIDYDAYLANDRTLDDPQVVQVDKGGRVRLRVINGATSTGFTLDLGALEGELIAVDGRPVKPLAGKGFPITMGQRLDVRLPIPQAGGTFPVLALREGAKERTGIILATNGATVSALDPMGEKPGPALDLALEQRLVALRPLEQKPVSRAFQVHLAGDMASYRWSLMVPQPLQVKKGERIEIMMHNMSMMAHPMHLHGHHFQVVGIGNKRVKGAVRDTVLVPPMQAVTIALDAINPGHWMFHCHHLFHMARGMMTTVDYTDFG